MIYFLRCNCANGFIKIGIARDLSQRIDKLKAASPYELEVIRVLPGGRPEERAIHERFAHCRHRGEWFKPEADLIAYISSEQHRCLGLQPPAEPVAQSTLLKARVKKFQADEHLKRVTERVVGSTGIEPVTFPMSRGRSPAELRARSNEPC